MRQKSLRTILAGGALVAALALAGPAPAHAAAGPGSVWSWLAGFWGERIAAPGIGTGQGRGERRYTGSAGREKAGSCVDPNGCAQAGARTAGPVCGLRNDAGVCLNPEG